MKKLIIGVVLLAVLVGGYIKLRNFRVAMNVFSGQTAQTRRGDLVVPITASGNIKPASITQVKSKASGEVVQIPFKPGQMVEKGDLLVELLDVDERRSVERAEADFNRAQIAVEQAKIAYRQRKTAALEAAMAKLKDTEARAFGAIRRYEFQLPLTQPAEGRPVAVPTEEWDQTLASRDAAVAAVLAAKADLENARIAIEAAEQDVKTAEENLNAMQAALNDAKERLRETKIYSPIDGMILVCNIQVGEVVQSGKTMFTGGTVLLEVADVTELYAVVNVDEADIGQVRELAPPSARPGPTATQATTMATDAIQEGQTVEVTVESFRDDKFAGVIERISPQSEVAQAIATFKVWIRITSENKDKLVGLLNGQAEAHFTARSVKDAVLVSYDAIQKNPNGEDYGVYVPVQGPERYKFRPCKFGADNGIDVEVVEGLKAGETVFTKLPQISRKEQEEKDKAS